MEEIDNDPISEALTTLLKPEIDLANDKLHGEVQARDYIFPNRSETTAIISNKRGDFLRPPFTQCAQNNWLRESSKKDSSKKFTRLIQMKLRVELPCHRIKKFKLATKRIKAFPCHLFPVV